MEKFFFSILTLLFNFCSPKTESTKFQKQPPLPDTEFVLAVQKQDDFTNDGIEIEAIKSGDSGLSNNC